MNALVPVPVRATPVSYVGRAAITQRIVAAFESPSAELFTAHDSRAEKVALIVDPDLPWVVRKGGKYPIIVGRYETQAEAECLALGLNHAQELTRAGGPPGPLEVAEAA
jgi:hypothetical protein